MHMQTKYIRVVKEDGTILQKTITTMPNGTKVSGQSDKANISAYNALMSKDVKPMTPTDMKFMLLNHANNLTSSPQRYNGRIKVETLYHCNQAGVKTCDLKINRAEILLQSGRTIELDKNINIYSIIDVVGKQLNEVKLKDTRKNITQVHLKFQFI